MTDRELMQQALEALERYGGVDQRACDAEEALRERLAQPEQVPWVKSYAEGKPNYTMPDEQEPGVKLDASAPLVVQPHPAFKKWQGLTDEEIADLYFDGFSMSELKQFARAIEAKLKKKNHG